MVLSPEWSDAHLGPVEVVSLALPDHAVPQAWEALLAAVDSHRIRLLDLEFVRQSESGPDILAADQLPDLVLPDLSGSSSYLLDDADLDTITADLQPGSIAAVLLVEHLGLFEVLQTFEQSGARLLLDGVLNHDDLDEVTSAQEA